MAIYHLNVKIIGRNSGRSAVAAAAYRSGDTITNEWDGLTHDYSRKGWIEHTEIFLPEHAPKEFRDRSALWNAVEAAEKAGSAQLVREIEVALPIELNQQEQLALVRNFIEKNFVSAGMCVDLAIHNPPVTDSRKRPVDEAGNPTQDREKMIFRNPHAHIMLTMRPLDEQGQWQAKCQNAYLCRKDNSEKSFTSLTIKEAEADGWQKQYQYKVGRKKVWLTKEAAEKKGLSRISKQPKTEKIQNPVLAEWNSKDALFRWRKSWADLCNESLRRNGIDEQISHLSYEAQGVNKIASVHMGVEATHAEKRGIQTELGEVNRQIEFDNIFLEKFEKQIRDMEQRENERLNKTAAHLESLRSRNIAAAYQQICFSMALAQEESNIDTQLQTTLALAKAAEQIMQAIESLEKSLSVHREQKEKCNPFQAEKRKELEQKITDTEQQIQNLKKRMDSIHGQQKQIQKVPGSSPEIIEQKRKQIKYLKEIQSQTYKEFYTLIKENQESMARLREIIQGKREDYDSRLIQSLKEHYADRFQKKILDQARAKAPEIPEADAAGIQKSISHKR